jgi:hypothetical protein
MLKPDGRARGLVGAERDMGIAVRADRDGLSARLEPDIGVPWEEYRDDGEPDSLAINPTGSRIRHTAFSAQVIVTPPVVSSATCEIASLYDVAQPHSDKAASATLAAAISASMLSSRWMVISGRAVRGG